MKKNHLILIFVSFGFLYLNSCENHNTIKAKTSKKIDYSKKSILDSLIKITPHSIDTMFLGFTIGMTKSDYKTHVQKLQKEGKEITYSKSNNFSAAFGSFDLGAGYTFKTAISKKESNKIITGQGNYFLEPIYNKEGKLMKLNILPIEKWVDDYGANKTNWLEMKIKENSDEFIDEQLKKVLTDNGIVKKYNFIRQKDNLIIHETGFSYSYVDLKTLYFEVLKKITEKEIIEEKNKELKF
jgi:hypothetical protein